MDIESIHLISSISFFFCEIGHTPTAFLFAVCDREQKWISSFARSQDLHSFRYYPPVVRDPSEHLKSLSRFKTAIPYIIPSKLPKLVQPTLWHHDMSLNNVFISSDELSEGRIVISSVLDWQNTWVGPLYVQARVPRMLSYISSWRSTELRVTKPPQNLDVSSNAYQTCAEEDILDANAEQYYRILMSRGILEYYEALADDLVQLFAKLAMFASPTWGGTLIAVSFTPTNHPVLGFADHVSVA